MIAVLILAGTVFALCTAALVTTWREYGQAARTIWDDARTCPETREVRYRIIEYGAKPAGRVVALPIKPKVAAVTVRQPLRAAA